MYKKNQLLQLGLPCVFNGSTFGIFDTFPNEAGRQAHLAGKVAEALFAQAPELFSQPPMVEKIEILAAKLPNGAG